MVPERQGGGDAQPDHCAPGEGNGNHALDACADQQKCSDEQNGEERYAMGFHDLSFLLMPDTGHELNKTVEPGLLSTLIIL